jgi:hypothetical protein
MNWYRAHFPTKLEGFLSQSGKVVTLEASPYYLFDKRAPERMSSVLPKIKLIALLRNPVERAYSHYHLNVRQGFEPLSFEQAIDHEAERLSGNSKDAPENVGHDSFERQAYSYLSRGLYFDQLEVWLRHFPREQVLLLCSEDYYRDASPVFAEVLRFTGLSPWQPAEFVKYKGQFLKEYPMYEGGIYPEMDPRTRARLTEYFAPFNEKLYQLLGKNLDWESGARDY